MMLWHHFYVNKFPLMTEIFIGPIYHNSYNALPKSSVPPKSFTEMTPKEPALL